MKNGDTLAQTFEYTLHTNGRGLWSDVAKPVNILRIECDIYSSGEVGDDIAPTEEMWGELLVYFDTNTWDTEVDGLIYTDKEFIDELRGYLELKGIDDNDIAYSEQGMQSDDYVSFDVGRDFIESWDLELWLNTPLPGN